MGSYLISLSTSHDISRVDATEQKKCVYIIMILRFIQKYNVYIHVNLMPVYHWCVYVTDMFMLT